MTIIRQNNILYRWTYILDTFNNEIISHHLSTREGDRNPYYQCLEDLKEKVKEHQQIIQSLNPLMDGLRRKYATIIQKRKNWIFLNFLNNYVEYFNNEQLAYALGYLSPVHYKIKQGFS